MFIVKFSGEFTSRKVGRDFDTKNRWIIFSIIFREFNSRNGDVSFGGGNPTDKGNALYYYKQALRFQDFEKAEKYLNDYKRLGGTPKGLKASIKRISPVAGVKKKEIREFKSTLSDAEKKTIRVALDWYKKIYKRK
mgnify:CR=1 FL=1